MMIISVTIGEQTYQVELSNLVKEGQELEIRVNGEAIQALIPFHWFDEDEMEWLIIGNQPYELVVDRDLRWIHAPFGTYTIEVRDRERLAVRPVNGDGRVKAPIPGLIRRVMVKSGDMVKAGQPLLILEAMKMENEIRSPVDGKVKSINIQPEQRVSQNEVMVEIS